MRKEIVVEVVDSIMGTGKSTECFKWIDQNPNQKYIYVSPNLSEVDRNGRIHQCVMGVNFISPMISGAVDDSYKTKTDHLTKLLETGENISCTHKLYMSMNDYHFSLIEKYGYIVLLDEEIDVIRTYGVYSSSDIQYLIDMKEISVNPVDGCISWIGGSDKPNNFDHKYYKLKKLCDKQSVYLNRGLSAKSNVLISHIPIKLLSSARRIIIITYMFKGSLMDCFLKIKGVKVVPCLDIVPTKKRSPICYRDLITLLPPNKKTSKLSMSASWWGSLTDKDRPHVASIANYIKNSANQYGAKPKDVIWTCPKDNAQGMSSNKNTIKLNPTGFVRYIDGENIKNCWLSVHTRATNDYIDKWFVAHCYNRFPIQPVKVYLQTCGHPIDEERYAISSLLQFVWRSCIRDDKPVVLLIANTRMFKLFNKWLDGGV